MGDEEKQKAPKRIRELVDQFERNLSSYKSSQYKEGQLREEFINPFFEALGWDMENKKGAAPAYRDVIHYDSLKISGGTKAPDYCYTLSGRRKFFVETKKPSINIKKDVNSVYQLRRYAWSAKLSLSILTNFEDFIIYESRQRPHIGDKPDVEKVKTISYKEYINRWDEIYSTFSYEAVLKGSFDKYSEKVKKKRGTKEVDDEFLEEIEGWREKLAKNIALKNPNLTVRELNYCVQRIIDRIIFLRMCEDKGIERYNQLQKIAEKENIYSNLCDIFYKADKKYNSGLFHFKKEKERNTLPDELTLKLTIDDKILKNIFRLLYYPNSPYEFSVISPEILGNIYERFLGKIIKLTERHRAKIEEKPEVKKAGGVYYTPQFIVEYIVDNTITNLIKGKTPKQISNIKILDPACGSGSFLLGAYSKLLQYHLDYYTARKNPRKYKDQIYQGINGELTLTIKEKKRILLNNIHGVDIDTQAVEVTKLSLLLKVLEGESKDIFEKQQKLWTERALPDLDNNIKCGNSTIGPDYYNSGIQSSLFNEDDIFKINAFDWKNEFKDIIKNGGFDAVIGNPPYRMLQPHNTTKDILNYLRNNYFAADFKIDFYHLFLQKGISLLKTKGGMLGFIIPVTLLNNVYIKSLRTLLTEKCIIKNISVANEKVFTADVHTCIVIFQTEPDSEIRNKNNILTTIELNESLIKNNKLSFKKTNQSIFNKLPGNIWNVLINNQNSKLIFRLIDNYKSIGENAEINRGLITGNREKYFSKNKISKKHIPIIVGADVSRYYTKPSSEFVLFERPNTAGGCWDEKVHMAPHKILIRQIGKRPTASIVEKPIAVTGNIFTIICYDLETEKFILGIINSKLARFFWKVMFTDFKTSFPQVTIFSLSQIPIPSIDISKPADEKLYNKSIKFIDIIINLYESLENTKIEDNKRMIQRQIEVMDQKIDEVVYKLFCLNDREKIIVETDLS